VSATTTQLLSSGWFYKLRYDTVPVKSASANVSLYNNKSKMPNLINKVYLYDPFSSPNIMRVIKSRRYEMGGACGTYGRQKRCVQGFGGGKLRERDHLEDLGVYGMTILKFISKKLDGAWTRLIRLRIWTGGGRL
jgi:hypothetical protein